MTPGFSSKKISAVEWLNSKKVFLWLLDALSDGSKKNWEKQRIKKTEPAIQIFKNVHQGKATISALLKKQISTKPYTKSDKGNHNSLKNPFGFFEEKHAWVIKRSISFRFQKEEKSFLLFGENQKSDLLIEILRCKIVQFAKYEDEPKIH